MSGTINFGGLASGMDTSGIIDALVNVRKVPLTQLQAQASQISQAKSTLSSFSTKLTALQTAAKSLSDTAGFTSATASSSDSAIVATVTGAAAPGAFDVSVTQVAKEQRTYSNTYASGTTALTQEGKISIQVGSGTKYQVDVTHGDSLASIAAAINQSGARVQASVLYDGSAYRLQVRGLDSGADNAVAFEETGTTLDLTVTANTFQKAQDAKIKVDGIEITRSNNLFTGVIPGVNLAVTKPTSTAATIQIAADSSALTTKINAFVSAYNAVIDAGHAAAGFGTQTATVTSMTGDFTVRNALDRISSLVGNNVAGTTGKYTTLGAVGLSSTRDGHLSFDSSKFATAVASDAATVAKLFVTDKGTGATGVMSGFVSTVDALITDTGNPFTARLKSYEDQTKTITAAQDRVQAQIDAYKESLTQTFSSMETAVSKYKSQSTYLTNWTNSSSSSSSSG